MTKLQAEIDFLAELLDLAATGELQIVKYPSGNGWTETDSRFVRAIKKRLVDLQSARSKGGKTGGGGRPKKDPSTYSASYKKRLGIK